MQEKMKKLVAESKQKKKSKKTLKEKKKVSGSGSSLGKSGVVTPYQTKNNSFNDSLSET